jgi:hypothetical protein
VCPQDLELKQGIVEIHDVVEFLSEDHMDIDGLEPQENLQDVTLHGPTL